ncbi:MAG TPA: 2-succinyl-5-enolpyruvyl-6-hydroxy-3-cyclohexene-1-carboxylic-acid synthase [Chthoniobacter sp.]|jgi:2-succinyl-5-enolpyruvyl-6-hydroxy-3-cyclohexene-1-carboxylate synthase
MTAFHESPATLDRNRNVWWCRLILEELRAGGLTHVVLCPGGRSSAMAMALSCDPVISTLVHTDERSAAFVALGLAKALRRPVAVCTTSGSAVANLVPAVLEAYHTNLPVILLTCDRPRSTRGSGAPQTADHAGLCGSSVQLSVDLDEPGTEASAVRTLRKQLAEIRRQSQWGPVHLNIPLRGVFTSLDKDVDWHGGPAAGEEGPEDVATHDAHPGVEAELPSWFPNRLGLRGLIVAASDSALSADQAGRLADVTGFPLLADAASGYRRPQCSWNLVTQADVMTSDPSFRAAPVEIIIRLGLAPVSHALHRYMGNQSCPTLKIEARNSTSDFLSQNFFSVRPSEAALEAVAGRFQQGDKKWLHFWQEGDARLRQRIESHLSNAAWSECLAAQMICNAPGYDFLHLANSMSVRHGNIFCTGSNQSQRIFANRGVNGIDGTLGTFFGELLGTGARGLLLVGDLTFLHDLPALEAVKHVGLNGTICLMDNSGGALFDLLGCESIPDYERFMRNPQSVDFSAISRAFGINTYECGDRTELAAALKQCATSSGLQLIHLRIPAHTLKSDVLGLFAACFTLS